MALDKILFEEKDRRKRLRREAQQKRLDSQKKL
jgi:hypothetical protein